MDVNLLLEKIEDIFRSEYSGTALTDLLKTGFGIATAAVKRSFGSLGIELGYEVGAHGFPGAHVGEWLYDVTWTMHKDEMLRRQILVLESEWKHGVGVAHNASVDRDFKKLVQARADIRVWVSTSHNEQLAQSHIENCIRQITEYSQSRAGDAYLLVIHTWSNQSTSIVRYCVP
jgi:hypothetical protein